MDHSEFQIGASLNRLYDLKNLGLLQNPANIISPFYKSVFIEFVIETHFLLKTDLLKEISKSINFRDDIEPYQSARGKEGYSDVKQLIEFYRHAICHSEAKSKRLYPQTGQYFAYIFQTATKNDNSSVPQVCKYEDDIAAIFGNHKLYVNRHLIRAYNELSEIAYATPTFIPFKELVLLRRKS